MADDRDERKVKTKGEYLTLGAGMGEVAVADSELDRLSAREREVMRLIARGYTFRTIDMYPEK